MPCQLQRFHGLSTENNVAQNALCLLNAIADYRGKAIFQIVFRRQYLQFLSIVRIEMKVFMPLQYVSS